MAACAAGIVAGLDVAGIERMSLAGYSMGGRLALYLAIHSDRFSRLVIESASPGMETRKSGAMRAAQDGAGPASGGDGAGGVPSFAPSWKNGTTSPLYIAQAAPRNAGYPYRAASCPRHACVAGSFASRALGTGVQPGLVAESVCVRHTYAPHHGGAGSQVYDHCRGHGPSCSAMAVEVFSGCGHNVHLENPGAWLTKGACFSAWWGQVPDSESCLGSEGARLTNAAQWGYSHRSD